MKFKKFYKIVLQVRKYFDENHESYGVDEDLMGLCAIASAKLFIELKKHGYNPQIAENTCHCFLVVNDHIVDITAGQFDKQRRIVIKHLSKRIKKLNHVEYYWEVEKLFDSVKDLRTYQFEMRWPNCQIASREIEQEENELLNVGNI